MRHDVFISYSRSDQSIAEALVDALRSRGVSVWYDQMIAPGADWREEIAAHLERSETLIILFSGETNKSAQLRKELSLADSAGLNVLPVLTEDVKPQGYYAYELAHRHWLDIHSDPIGRIHEVAGHFNSHGIDPEIASNETPIKLQPASVRSGLEGMDSTGPESAQTSGRQWWRFVWFHRRRPILLWALGVGAFMFLVFTSSEDSIIADLMGGVTFSTLTWAMLTTISDRKLDFFNKSNLIRRLVHSIIIVLAVVLYSFSVGNQVYPTNISEVFGYIIVILMLSVPVCLFFLALHVFSRRVYTANSPERETN